MGYAVDNAGWLLYNQNVAGMPAGSVTRTASCPLAGTVAITGSTNVASNGVNGTQLTFTMVNCGVSAASYSLTFNGALQMSGTFTAMTQNDITFSSSNLSISGQVKVLDDPSVNETCSVSMTDTWNYKPNDVSGWLNGLVCGRSADGTVLFPQSGSSGSSSGSGSSASADWKCLLESMELRENGQLVEFDDVPDTALAAADGGVSTTGSAAPQITSAPGPMTFVNGGGQPLDLAFTDPTASRPAFFMTLRPAAGNLQCFGPCCWGCRATRRRFDKLTSGVAQYQATTTSDPTITSAGNLIVYPVSCAEPGVDPVAAVTYGSSCTLVTGSPIPVGITFGAPPTTGGSSGGGSGSSGSSASGSSSGTGSSSGGGAACRTTCANGGITVSTLSCTPLGTSGTSNYCLSSSEYTGATGMPLPQCCFPANTTGCLDTAAGTLVKPCCSGLTCRVSSSCGDPSGVVGGTCLP